jgi:hypothetical protein
MRVIETHQRAQRGQAQTGALLPVGEQGLQGGQRSCVAKLPQGLDGGEAHRLLGIGEQGEQEAKACALLGTIQDGHDALAALLRVEIGQPDQQDGERDGGWVHVGFLLPGS